MNIDKARYENLKCFMRDVEGCGLTAIELRSFEVAKLIAEEAVKSGKSFADCYTKWSMEHSHIEAEYKDYVYDCLGHIQGEMDGFDADMLNLKGGIAIAEAAPPPVRKPTMKKPVSSAELQEAIHQYNVDHVNELADRFKKPVSSAELQEAIHQYNVDHVNELADRFKKLIQFDYDMAYQALKVFQVSTFAGLHESQYAAFSVYLSQHGF